MCEEREGGRERRARGTEIHRRLRSQPSPPSLSQAPPCLPYLPADALTPTAPAIAALASALELGLRTPAPAFWAGLAGGSAGGSTSSPAGAALAAALDSYLHFAR